MMPSRFLIAGVATALIGAAVPALAQTACLQPAERTAFDVRALQSQLMVVALTCGEQDRYNAFVRRYSRELGGAYQSINASYRRAGGQRAMDGYITSMANAQSQDGIRQGTHFCMNASPMLDAAMAAPAETAALAQVARANNLANPHGRDECATRATTPAPAGRPARSRQSTAEVAVRPAAATTR